MEPVEETEIAAFEGLDGDANGQGVVERRDILSRNKSHVEVEHGATDDVGIGGDVEVGGEAAVLFDVADGDGVFSDLQAAVVAIGRQIGAWCHDMADVLAVDVQDEAFAWVGIAVVVAHVVITIKGVKLQVGRLG